MVDLLIRAPVADAVRARISGHDVHVPSHFDAEVLSAIGRLVRTGAITSEAADDHLDRLSSSTFPRHDCAPLVKGAWRRREVVRLADALYVELGATLGVPMVTTDARLARAASGVELVEPVPAAEHGAETGRPTTDPADPGSEGTPP